MYDLYAIEVQAEKNPVNGKEYRSINSIMNYCYDNKMWDELTVFIMNANRYGERPDMTSLSTYFPAEIGVKVVDPKGKAVVGATVNFYPGKWYDYSIAATYSHQGISNSRGVFCFSHNPFVEGKEVKIPSLLIEITHKGEKYYDWLPVNELQLAWVKGAKASYLKTVQISK